MPYLTLAGSGFVEALASVSSSHGYVASGPAGQKTPRVIGSLPSAECTITSDQTLALLAAAAKGKSLPGAIISAEVKALTLLWTDNGILDAINNGRLTPDVEVLLGVALLFYPCGHSAMLRNTDAAVFSCNRGGVGWPKWIVFYGPGPKVIGAFDMSTVVGDARGGTKRISFARGKITVDTWTHAMTTPAAVPAGGQR